MMPIGHSHPYFGKSLIPSTINIPGVLFIFTLFLASLVNRSLTGHPALMGNRPRTLRSGVRTGTGTGMPFSRTGLKHSTGISPESGHPNNSGSRRVRSGDSDGRRYPHFLPKRTLSEKLGDYIIVYPCETGKNTRRRAFE